MGQAQSDSFASDIPVPDTTTKPSAERATKLFQFISGPKGGSWTLVSGNARPTFYNANEDSGKKAKPEWHMEVDGSDVDVPVTFLDMNYEANLRELRLTFSSKNDIYALRFGNEEQFRAFGQELTDKTFTNMSGLENDEASRSKELGDDYAGLLFANNPEQQEQAMRPMDVDSGPDVPTPAELRATQAKMNGQGEQEHISGVVIGAGENSFLMHGNQFDVLRNVHGGVEDKHVGFTLTPMKGTPGGIGGSSTPTMTPSRVLLANTERSMIVLTPENKHAVSMADIETGKVVQTYKFEKDGVDIPMADIHHDNKAAQMEMRSTFMSLDSNRLCRWDMRDPHGVVAQSPLAYTAGKDYSRGTNFTCMATSGDGFVAVGSKDGKVRLYSSKTLTKANTAIPGLGSPITAIDVTYDGKYVVATTDKYLMVVKTTYEDDKGKECNGFVNRMGGRGAVPRLLRLKPEDNARTGGKPFGKGKFTWITEAGVTERWVVAQCGNYSVVWNFRRIRSMAADSLSYGGMPTCMDYVLSQRDEDVVDAAFLHPKYAKLGGTGGDGDTLLVATPNKIFNVGG